MLEKTKIMKTYVVMPHYIVTDELKELAINAIKSFKENSDVILISVDDWSTLDTTFLKEQSDYYIRNDVNMWFAKTCNVWFEKVFELSVDNCYIICANNDIIVNERVVPELKRPFETYGNVAITGIFSTDATEWEWKELKEIDWGKISSGGFLWDRMQDGGLWMSTKEVLKKIGLFDERFERWGFEDFDLFLRARDTFNMKIIMSNRAVYWHKQWATRWNASFIEWYAEESLKINESNAAKFCEKWNMPLSSVKFTENILK